jgi:hypothetical protein
VPRREALKKKILDEAHTSRYSIHPGSTKMYHDLRKQFWWTRMKRETARYVSKCDTCRKVNADYMKAGGLLQPLSILEWKWDDISMDFIVGFPLTARKFACFCEDAEGTLWFKERLIVPRREALKKKILDESHTSRYSIHPGSTKMYHDLRQQFWWTRMKRETTRYVSECDTCRKVKADYMKPKGLLQLLSIPE